MVSFQARLKLVAVFSAVLLVTGLMFNQAALADDTNVTWAQLNDGQRQILNPLASEWDTLRPWQR